MPADPTTLLVVAHPDDEALWFSSVLTRRAPVELVVVTCGGDPQTHERRRGELARSAERYGIANVTVLDQQDDITRRLDLEALRRQLAPFAERAFRDVFTHGPIGETFTHPHHQDVCLVVHELFDSVWSTCWNQLPDAVETLSDQEYELKLHVMGTIYWPEYLRLAPTYEISPVERFARHARESVRELYLLATLGKGEQVPGEYALEHAAKLRELAAAAGVTDGGQPISRCSWSGQAPDDGFVALHRAALSTERRLVVLSDIRSAAELERAFSGLRAAHAISDLPPSPELAAAAERAARAAGYSTMAKILVTPRFERLATHERAFTYKRGAALTLWQRTHRRRLAPRLREAAKRTLRRS